MLLRTFDTSTSRAKKPVKTRPITVSSLMRDFYAGSIVATEPT